MRAEYMETHLEGLLETRQGNDLMLEALHGGHCKLQIGTAVTAVEVVKEPTEG